MIEIDFENYDFTPNNKHEIVKKTLTNKNDLLHYLINLLKTDVDATVLSKFDGIYVTFQNEKIFIKITP